MIPFYGGEGLATVYDKALGEGLSLIASNIMEPSVMMGFMEGVDRTDSGLLLQMGGGACRFAGDGDAVVGLEAMGNYIETIAERCDIGVFLNIDHQTDLKFIEQQIELDIPSSIMIDASRKPFDENVAASREVAEMVEAAGSDVFVEAELDQVKGAEDEIEAEEAFHTGPEQAIGFIDKTGADLLAISVGIQHGVVKSKDLELRPDLADGIRQALRDHGLNTPLVLHGSSGVQPDQLQKMLKHGICEVNKDTRYQYEYTRTAHDRYSEEPNAIVPPEDIASAHDTSFNEADWLLNKDMLDPRAVGHGICEHIADVHANLTEASGSAGQSLFK